MSEAVIKKLGDTISTLETRLDALERKFGCGNDHSTTKSGSSAPQVIAWNNLIDSHFPKLLELSAQIAPEVKSHLELLKKAFNETGALIAHASMNSKPSDMSSLLKPISGAINAIVSSRPKTSFQNNITAINESASVLGWVSVTPNPVGVAKDTSESVFVFTNRILKDSKGSNQIQSDWAKNFADLIRAIPNYINEHHKCGLSFKSG